MRVPGNVNETDGHAKVTVDYNTEWRDFDNLPKPVRELITNMPVEFSVAQIAQEYREARNFHDLSVYDYVKHLDGNFRMFVKHESISKQEQYPYDYKIKPRIQTKRVYGRPDGFGGGVHR